MRSLFATNKLVLILPYLGRRNRLTLTKYFRNRRLRAVLQKYSVSVTRQI